MTKRDSIIIDCDPGIDDAVALLLAFASPEEIDVKAITTVAGNVPLHRTEANARRIRDLAGRHEIPIHAGCPRPLLKPLVTADDVHGKTGLDGSELPEPASRLADGHGADVLRRELAAAPGGTKLLPVGPLTNVAHALVARPELADEVSSIVLMGGSTGRGNITPHAEFNFHVDPHAARIVFESGAPIVMHGLNVTHQVRAKPDWIAELRALGTKVGDTAAGMLTFYDSDNDPALHDVLTVGSLLWPELFSGEERRVEIVTEGEEAGRSIVHTAGDGAPNATVIMEIDAPEFLSRLLDRLARYS
ncbi:MAG: nucleoside hydrolase [Nisaea sp.]|uniref:nucleoside hydrolase n=1 Tax=Nisaea sp. TaxID=2024842 RepID=UPI001AFD5B4F|nr:nucleoside hydrolase [Nisaea sp.]MBO6560782.1 nucleoside hydrolase [Nisaea sp.]